MLLITGELLSITMLFLAGQGCVLTQLTLIPGLPVLLLMLCVISSAMRGAGHSYRGTEIDCY